MSFYLLDRKVSGPRKWYAASTEKRVCVQHITAGLEDLRLTDDQSAEATARYCATTDRPVSWHVGVDTDSVVPLLPTRYTAFHVGGFNTPSIGQEISKKDTRWARMPAAWVEATLHNSADAWRPIVEEFSIPLRLLTADEARAGRKGFIQHAALDPSRRSDPGDDFPWDLLFQLIARPGPGPGSPAAGRPTLGYGSEGYWVQVLQEVIGVEPDGKFGPQTQQALIAWQHAHELVPDGICGPATWARIDEEGDMTDEERTLLRQIHEGLQQQRETHAWAAETHAMAVQLTADVAELRGEIEALRGAES